MRLLGASVPPNAPFNPTPTPETVMLISTKANNRCVIILSVHLSDLTRAVIIVTSTALSDKDKPSETTMMHLSCSSVSQTQTEMKSLLCTKIRAG